MVFVGKNKETLYVSTLKVVTILLMIPGLILVIQPPFIFPEVRNIILVKLRVRVRVRVKVKSQKSKLDPEVGSVMGWPTHHHHHPGNFF